MSATASLPRVTVLLATHQGERFLDEQLDSILSQEGAELTVLVSDDGSTDGTLGILERRMQSDDRIRTLPAQRFGAPGPNFFRLLVDADPESYDYVGFADQDDVWMPDKIARHIAILRDHEADGVSSNVTAFDHEGNRVLVKKDYPQRLADHLFESPGPGSSVLLTNRLARMVAAQLADEASPARRAFAHETLIYALARSAGCTWVIDSESSVDYRQHDAQAVGANAGIAPALKRIRLTAARWHREQARIAVDAGIRVASPEELPRLQWFHEVLEEPWPIGAARLARRASQFRRRPRDRFAIAALMMLGLW